MAIDKTLKRYFPGVVLTLIAVATYFQAHGLAELLATALGSGDRPSTVSPPRRSSGIKAERSSGQAILERNPFDSVTGPLPSAPDLGSAPAAKALDASDSMLFTAPSRPAAELGPAPASRTLGSFVSAVRVVPERKDGKIVGLRLFGIRPNALLGSLGFRNGDRLESINGFDVASPEKALEAYARLRTANDIRVQINRLGKPVEINLHII